MKRLLFLVSFFIIQACTEARAELVPGNVNTATSYPSGASVAGNTLAPQIAMYEFTATSCTPTSSSTTYATFTADTDCTAVVAATGITNPWTLVGTDTDKPSWSYTSLPAGKYRITVGVPVQWDGAAPYTLGIGISDGTNTRGQTSSVQSSASDINYIVTQAVFEYASAGARTFEVFGRVSANTITLRCDNTTNLKMTITVERL